MQNLEAKKSQMFNSVDRNHEFLSDNLSAAAGAAPELLAGSETHEAAPIREFVFVAGQETHEAVLGATSELVAES